jgi:hypothetical protein
MTNGHKARSVAPLQDCKPVSIYPARIARALLIAAVVAVFCMAIFFAMGEIKLSQSGIKFIFALVYSVSIALPSMFVLYGINIRYADQYPRLVFLFDALALIGTASFGVLAGGLFEP